ncbi:MAG: hypothetical protein IK038_12560 [Bacteroidaceae bacterium]|nr:hypothetical protein [Bacteroidaceae bacterium]
MNEADYEKLVKEYEKIAKKADKPLLTFDDLVSSRLDLKKVLPPDTEEKRFKEAVRDVRYYESEMGIYLAFKNRDVEMLNNALYVAAQATQISNISQPGADHGYYGMNITPLILAANIPERINKLLKKEYGLSSAVQTGPILANLLMAIWFEDEELKTKAFEKAQKKLAQKITDYERGFINCYTSILQKDIDGVNNGLVDLCRGIYSFRGMDSFSKGFCIAAHAVYNLSHWAYGGELENSIKIPDEPNFCQELVQYQKEHGYKHGRVFNTYPPELDEFNKVMQCEPPEMHLIQDGRNRYIDTKRYLNDVLQILLA